MTATLEEAEKTFIKFMKYGDSKATAMTGKNFSKVIVIYNYCSFLISIV